MKERIMDAFIDEVRLHGMKFTMDDLSKKIGISKRTLYEHFSSKVSILDTIIERSLEHMDQKTAHIMQDNRLSLVEKIKAVMMVLPSHFEFYDLRNLEQMKRYYPEQWHKVDTALRAEWDQLQLLIEQGIREGEIVDVNVPLVIKLAIDATNTILDQRFFAENHITVDEALTSIVDILMYGLIPEQKR